MKNYRLLAILMLVAFTSSYAQSVDIPIILSDNSGGTTTLKFGLDPTATNGIDASLGESELPPPPPTGVFDARFIGDDIGINMGQGLDKDYRQGPNTYVGQQIHEFKYQVGTGTIITFSWNFPIGVTGRLQDLITGTIIDVSMSAVGNYSVSSPSVLNKLKMSVNYNLVPSTQTLQTISPNGGEIWTVGTTQNITWTSSNVTIVKLEYTVNSGTDWITIVASTPANSGMYAWTVPNTTSTNCKVRISDANNSQISDISDNTFTILELPSDPVLSSPVNNSNGIVQPVFTEWNRASNADTYILQISADSNFASSIFVDSSLTDTTKLLPALSNYTQYYWKVKAVNIGGESNWSEVWNFKTLGNPYASNLITPLNNSVNQPINGLVFKWTKAKERIETIQKYQYQLSTDSLFVNVVVNDSTLTDTTNTVNSLNYLTKYYWRVRANNETGWGDWSEVWNTTTIIEKPTTPVLALPANNIKGLIQPILTKWNSPLRVEKYHLQVSTDSTFATLSFVDSSFTDTTKLLPTLSNYTQYYWRVKAVNIGGESNWSDVWNFKTLGNPYASNLITPLNNSVNQPINDLVFNWTKAKERIETIQKYHYQLSTDSLFANVVVNDSTLTDTTKTVNSLNYLTKYYWRVRANNETGWGDWSEVWNTTTIIEKPTTPVLALPANNIKGLIQPILTKWNSSLRVEKYILQVSTEPTFATLIFVDSSLTDTTKQLPMLSNYTQYYWKVKAVNIGGESNWSDVWNFKTLGNPYASNLITPSNNSVNQPINDLVFNWTKAKERIETIQKYHYQLSTDSLFTNVVINDSTLTDTTKMMNSLNYLTKYYWRVRASNETGWGDWSLVSRFTTIIEKPTTPLLALPSNNGKGLVQPILTKWNSALRVEKYHLQVSASSNFTSYAFVDSSLTDTTKLLPTLSNYTQYYWRVKAVNIGGESNWSEVWNFKTLGNPYASNLIIPSNNSVHQPINNLTFKWTKAKERIETIQKYQYQLSTDSIFTNVVINDSTLTDTAKTVNSLNYLTKYYWRVRASNETGWGDWSDVWNATTIIEKPTTPVLALPANNIKGLIQPILTKWNKSLRVEKYHLQVSTDSTFTTITLVDSSLTDTTKLLPSLSNYTQYYWRVKAVNVGGESEWSNVFNFKTLGNPYASNLITPLNNSVNQPINGFVFKWTKAKERIETIQKYQYQLSTDSLFVNVVVNDSTLTDTTKTVNSSNYLTKYYWRVRASNETGWGDWSEVWNTTTIIEKPAITVLALPLNNATKQLQPVTLKWNKTPRAEKYRLEVSEFSNFSTLLLVDSTLTDTLRVLPQLEYPKTYYWRVRGSNIGGTGDYSATWNFRTLGLPLIVELVTPSNNSINQPINDLLFKWRKGGEQTLYAAPVKRGGTLKTLDRIESPKMSINSFANEIEVEQNKGENGNGIETVLNYWLQVMQDTSSTTYIYNDSTLTDTTKILSGFTYLTNYYWRVKGKNENGWGDYSLWNRFTTIIEKPITPTLAAPGNDTTGLLQPITVKWNSSLRAEKYSIQVSTEQTFGSIAFADSNITDTTKLLPMLLHFTHYYWRVKAMNIGGGSEWSNVWNFRTLGSPTTVSLVYPENNAINIPVSFSFKWTKANNQELAISYWFELSIDTTTILMLDSTLTDTTKSVSGLQNDKQYYWRVKAKNEAGWNNFTAWSKFRTIVPIPSVTGLVAPQNNATSISLTPTLVWRRVAYAMHYTLQVASDSTFTTLIVNDTSLVDTIKTLDTLLYKTNYYWRVRSSNIAGNSGFSSMWKFTTLKRPVSAPTNLIATATEPRKANLAWIDNSSNEIGFAIMRKDGDSTSGNPLLVIDTVLANSIAFVDTTVADSVKYSYRIYAFSLDTISAPSNYATVITLTSIKEILSGEVPKDYSIAQNYPNPFNPVTTIQYGMPFTSEVNIAVYDMVGQKITTLVNCEQNSGYYEVTFEIDGLSSGIYFYVITAKQTEGEKTFRKVMKMILMK